MKCFYAIFLSTLLGGGAFAANSKLNQYASISDCQSDSNIISHASPAEGSCHQVDGKTKALYLVTGSGAAGAQFIGYQQGSCGGPYVLGVTLDRGSCISRPDSLKSIEFGLIN
ncbi:hypothetical protein V499_05902 [Pseudogymnoascus sp. VKM F-103]|uniref:Uncharacterized protein n=1 Tax=Pseudogymnoascus verrucosus TaxID=342668 RepID=A0A1B8GVH6_9PEZI|nr:uncharacterized protein VE01_02118 [Pseudogymnoascus verrucosus]KFY74051.1 hypothetical protein V499_05902 [Pseudogymnoascus sp. VKM F-103]OBT99833.1 hypothetical protein VE01_02118 [Pseudogymnoascus verrucosus]